jgi:glucokinase-like ROK family protein
MNQSATTHLMRRLNRSAILDLLREHSPIARAEISRRLHISIPTVMRIVDELMAEDLARWCGHSESSGGRPRDLLEFNQLGYAVIGIDLGGTKMFGTVADLGGNIQEEIYLPWEPESAENKLEQVCRLIDKLIHAPRPDGQRLRGIGIGAPGVTLAEKGIVTWAPSLGWRDLPLRDILMERFHIPVVVDNDVNLAAMGEHGFGAGKGASSLVCIAVGTGIGSGIIIDRSIYRGFHQSAGEIGYLLPDKDALGKRYDKFGALENLASGTGVEARAEKLWHELGMPYPEEGISAEEVFNAARTGQAWAVRVVDETVDYLSLAIAAISLLFDPEVIVLGGGVARSADILIDPIIKRLVGVLPAPVTLLPSTLGYRAAVLGAIMLVLDSTTNRVSVSGQI